MKSLSFSFPDEILRVFKWAKADKKTKGPLRARPLIYLIRFLANKQEIKNDFDSWRIIKKSKTIHEQQSEGLHVPTERPREVDRDLEEL